MASILQVEELRGPTSGANANKVIIPSGQTLELTSGSVIELPAGSISNFNANLATNRTDTGTTSYQDVINTTITPSSTDSKILIIAHVLSNGRNATSYQFWHALFRNSNNLVQQRMESVVGLGNDLRHLSYIDEPNTTNEVTYSLKYRTNSGGYVTLGDNGSRYIAVLELKA